MVEGGSFSKHMSQAPKMSLCKVSDYFACRGRYVDNKASLISLLDKTFVCLFPESWVLKFCWFLVSWPFWPPSYTFSPIRLCSEIVLGMLVLLAFDVCMSHRSFLERGFVSPCAKFMPRCRRQRVVCWSTRHTHKAGIRFSGISIERVLLMNAFGTIKVTLPWYWRILYVSIS